MTVREGGCLCGKVRFRPKFAPEAISMRLFGPGVIDDTRANPARPQSSVGLIDDFPKRSRTGVRSRIDLTSRGSGLASTEIVARAGIVSAKGRKAGQGIWRH